MKKIVFINGSLRKNSFNMQLAKIMEKLLENKADVSYMEYTDVPFFNQDMEFPPPESVQRVRSQIMDADGLWIFTPEYNYQIPGVLKNLLDWLSRPVEPKGVSAVKGKKVTISGVAGKSGAAGARKNLYALVQSMRMEVIGGEGSGISLDGTAWATDMLTLSVENTEMLKKQIDLFMEFI